MKWQFAVLAVLVLGGTIIFASSGDRFTQFTHLSSPDKKSTVNLQKSPPPTEQSAELVVMSAPKKFAETVTQLGFVVSERLHFEDLDTVAYRILPPAGMSYAVAEQKLNDRFPGIIVQINEIDIVPSSKKDRR